MERRSRNTLSIIIIVVVAGVVMIIIIIIVVVIINITLKGTTFPANLAVKPVTVFAVVISSPTGLKLNAAEAEEREELNGL